MPRSSFIRIRNMYGYDVFIGRNVCTVRDKRGINVWAGDRIQAVHSGTNVDAFKRPRYGLPANWTPDQPVPGNTPPWKS